MDGLVCGILLKELDMIEDITFAHPKDMQDGLIDVGPDDITTNLPYAPGAYLSFDHHASETTRVGGKKQNHVIDPKAPSAARVVYDYFGGAEAFPNIAASMKRSMKSWLCPTLKNASIFIWRTNKNAAIKLSVAPSFIKI